MNITTAHQLLQQSAERLRAANLYYGHGTDNPDDEAFWLVCHALGCSVHQPLADSPVDADACQQVEQLIQQRITTRQPAAYLTGSAWFAGLQFAVSDQVLVPRSPLAELIREDFSPWLDTATVTRVLDIGTGCGCIGIAAAVYNPAVHLTGCDISPVALELARKNAEIHDLNSRSRWLESDLFDALQDEQFDLILSNPPYVPLARQTELPDEYQAEPGLGLYSGEDGLAHAARLLHQASRHLRPGGHFVLEIGESAATLEAQLPMIPFVWPEFEFGGEGVLIASKDLLDTHEHDIKHWYAQRTASSPANQ